MTQSNENQNDSKLEEESFADLFEAYNKNTDDDFKVGDKIKGDIISIGMDTVFINTGSKIDAAVNKEELMDNNGEFPYKAGDTLELYVVSANENEIRLSKALSGAGGLNILQDAFKARLPVEGKVMEECKGGFRVRVMHKTAFCPMSQMDIKYVQSPDEYLGKTFPFIITKFGEKGRNIVLSRKAILAEELKKAKDEFVKKIKQGDVLEGKVTAIMPYGIFVELFPSIEGMVHISELSWSRTDDPGKLFKKDDTVKVKIMGIEKGNKPDSPKISLSVKQITGDPWHSEMAKLKKGDKIKGIVTRCMPFGVFVEIAPGVEGLVHISEISHTKRVVRPRDEVDINEQVDVVIKEIDPEKRRISLSMRDAAGNLWVDDMKKQYSESRPGKAADSPFGTLGEKLKEAMKSKKS